MERKQVKMLFDPTYSLKSYQFPNCFMKNRSALFNQQPLLILILLIVVFSSCRSHRELMYLRDVRGQEGSAGNSQENLAGLPKPQPVYSIKVKDNLYVSIISPNPELNKVYNPPAVSSNASVSNQFDNLAGQFIHGYEVETDGSITLPIIGKVNVAGKTIVQSENEIEDKAKTFLKEVTVKVKLLNFRVTVLGEVKNPGLYHTYSYNFSTLDAIGMANGNTDFASLSNVMVVRPTKEGSRTFTLNLNNKSALSSDGYYLQPNDVVFIQPARNKFIQPRVSAATLILSSISSVLLLLNYIDK
jgi:polysaccharide biosynthesis/export protein